MSFGRHLVRALGLLPVVFCSGLVEAASTPCVVSGTIRAGGV
jgi:hypothetical protein